MSYNLEKKARQESKEGNDLSDSQMKKIIHQCDNNLVVPKIKNKDQILLCPVGLVGSGKTTVTKKITKKLNLLRISTDEIRVVLKKKGFNLLRTVDIAIILTNKYIDKKLSLALDGDAITPEIQKHLAKLAKEKNLVPIWIHINTSEKVILSRMRKNILSKFFDNSEKAIFEYKRRKPLHEKYLSKINFFYTFNSSNNNIDKQINDFVKKLRVEYNVC